ncbi:Ulp1 peptidase [Ranunculus cassubicifolius]
MFPIIHRKNAKDKEGYHWSLLVLDTTDWSWSHYDSLRPRKKNSKSKTLDDAILFKSRIASTIKLHKSLTKEEKEMVDGDVNVEPCPQQGNTVNCAIYVCHYMKSLFVDKTLPHETDKEGAESVKKLKVDICCNILKEKATRRKAGHH